jgi:predicted lysophospholipase L1 biosynthesis ABC-type transport system permease subunit
MFRTYLRQELVDPVRGAGRYLAIGVAGSFLLSVGIVLLALGVLRGLQSLAVFEGSGRDIVPYLATLVAVVVTSGVVIARIPRDSLHGRNR